jgi:3-hydroxyisobutyrate dehydrogenase-like beta-hydroxyacid dehydrogenase
MEIAVLGLGEAGRVYAEGLQRRGAAVRGFDPAYSGEPFEIDTIASSVESAVRGADVTLSLVGASAAEAVADQAHAVMDTGTVFADLNTASPDLMRRLAARANAASVRFVDVAIMAPVPRAGVDTPLLACGTGAAWLTDALTALRLPIEDVGPEAGVAAGLKLLRSVFMKGLAALTFESLTAAERTGSAEWMRSQIAAELGPAGGALVDRLVTGTNQHAARRAREMRDAREFVESLGTPSPMTAATLEWLECLADSPSTIR